MSNNNFPQTKKEDEKIKHSESLSGWVYVVIAVALLVILYVIANEDPDFLSHRYLITSIQDDPNVKV